jgi:hypothetical protein
MKAVFVLSFVCSLLLMRPPVAAAQAVSSPHSNAGVAIKLSTFGVGVDLAVPVSDTVNIRGGFSAFSISHDFDEDGLNLAASLKLKSVSAILDWFPFAGGFHVSPGVMIYNGNEVDAIATVPGGKRFDLGDEDLISNPASPVNGSLKVGFERVAPSIAIGWGNIVPRGNRRWSIPFELGVVYSRSPRATLTLAGSACNPNGTNCRNIASDPTLQADLAKQQADLNSDISVLKLLPIMSLGFSYKF